MNVVLVPEIILRVTKQFYERHKSAPRVWTMDEEALEQDPGHNFLEVLNLDIHEQV